MSIIINTGLILFLLFWLGVGAWLLVRYEDIFGLHADDPAETPGARTLNMTQVWSVWVGIFLIDLYFLFT